LAGGGGVKRLGRDIDHSSPLSVKVKNKWSCASTPPICLRGVDRENVTLFFTIYRITILGHALAQLVEALRYKSEDRGFDTR